MNEADNYICQTAWRKKIFRNNFCTFLLFTGGGAGGCAATTEYGVDSECFGKKNQYVVECPAPKGVYCLTQLLYNLYLLIKKLYLCGRDEVIEKWEDYFRKIEYYCKI